LGLGIDPKEIEKKIQLELLLTKFTNFKVKSLVHFLVKAITET